MAQNLTTSFASDVKASGAEPVLGIRHREIFWHPRYLRVSNYTAHLPFLFWMIADLRPRRCVTLGLGTGVAHFAVCQAVEKLGLEAVCHGLDSRNPADMPADLHDYNANNYDDFSKLYSSTDPLEAVDHGDIDLLVVDQPVTAMFLGQIANEWTAKLSQPAIIVLAGVQEAAKDAEIARALAGLRQRFEHIAFDHDGGLLVLCTAHNATTDDVADRFHRLASLPRSSPEHHIVVQVFRRLGQLNVSSMRARSEGARADRLEADLKVRMQAHAKIEAQLDEARAKHASLSSAYDARHSQVATVQAEMFDLKSALQAQENLNEQLEQDLGIARVAQAKFVEQISARDNRIAELTEAYEQETTSRAELQKVVTNRDHDIQVLIERIEAAEVALKTNHAISEEWAKERQTLNADLAASKAKREEFWQLIKTLREERSTAQNALSELQDKSVAELTDMKAALQRAETASKDAEEAQKELQAGLTEAISKRKELWQQKSKLDTECKTLQEKVDAAEIALTRAQEHSLREISKRDTALSDLAGQLEVEKVAKDKAVARIAEVQHEVQALSLKLIEKTQIEKETEAKLKAALVQANQRIAERDTKLRDTRKQLESTKKAHDTLLDQSAVLSAQVTLLTERATNAEQECENLRIWLDNTLKSTSWRVTAPLRGIKTAVASKR